MDWRETSATLARARAEQPVSFAGPRGALYGIFTPPAAEAPPAGVCLMLPARPRFGRKRFTVLTARVMAAEGFACLRFDFSGEGESGGRAASPSRWWFDGADVVAALRYAREVPGSPRVVIVGYCLDALKVLDAFVDQPDAIAGLFLATPPATLDRIAYPIVTNAGGKGRLSWLGRHLRSMYRHPEEVISTARTIVRIFQRSIPIGQRQRGFPLMKSFETAFAALVRSRARALFLYGEPDKIYKEFQGESHRLFSALDAEARTRLQIEVWPGRVHAAESTRAIFARAVAWVREFHPASGARAEASNPANRDRHEAPI
jgi:alpha-beta hydrolase superfamily lysophospholipase